MVYPEFTGPWWTGSNQKELTMLVITRNTTHNTITIGDNIQIKVVQVKGNQVRIAIDAPKEVAIVREERRKYV